MVLNLARSGWQNDGGRMICSVFFMVHPVYAYLCPEGAETNQPRAKRNGEAV